MIIAFKDNHGKPATRIVMTQEYHDKVQKSQVDRERNHQQEALDLGERLGFDTSSKIRKHERRIAMHLETNIPSLYRLPVFVDDSVDGIEIR